MADKLVIRDREATGLELWKPATGGKIGAAQRSIAVKGIGDSDPKA